MLVRFKYQSEYHSVENNLNRNQDFGDDFDVCYPLATRYTFNK